jgi:DNA-3-methyladenine glycosylase
VIVFSKIIANAIKTNRQAYLVERHLSKFMILKRSFYEQEVITVATALLGKILVHESVDGTTAGRIVETEAYLGPEDEAAHSSGGRRTTRNEVMYGLKGHAYVYFIYGLYYCLNVTAGDVPGKPEAVLLRAIEPVAGEDIMAKRRQLAEGKNANLTNGPSKLCMAMGISKRQNKAAITTPPIYINDAPAPEEAIVETTRIGVDYAGEWKNRNWRFYLKENLFVSKK